MYKNLAATLLAALAMSAVPGVSAQTSGSSPSTPVRAAWMYVTPVTDAGWTRQHDDARLQVERALGNSVRTTHVASVAEGPDAERVLRDLARQGNQIIFTTSFGYMEPAMKVAREFPQVKFEVLTGYRQAPNIATANARYYEGRYLAGIAAGRVTRSNLAGYVVGFPIPEVLQGINAFTQGMRSVNPKAQVRVIWLNEWFNPSREREAATLLMDQGADVLAFHTGSTAVPVAAQQRGRWVIGYHSDMRRYAPDYQLLSISHLWGDYEVSRIKALQQGSWKSQNVWNGVRQGAIRVGNFGRKVPAAVQQEVLRRQQELAAGKLQPFAGPITDRDGKLRVAAGQALSDAQVLSMNWLAQGVQAPPLGK